MQCVCVTRSKISDMKIEFLKSGSPECPVVRLYEFEASGAYHLRRIALRLARGPYQAIPLHEEPVALSIGGCQLSLSRGERDRGVLETAPLEFSWGFSRSSWLRVAGLIRPFSRGDLNGFQWLSEVGGIRILLSPSGQ
jgi:hypothetical protein